MKKFSINTAVMLILLLVAVIVIVMSIPEIKDLVLRGTYPCVVVISADTSDSLLDDEINGKVKFVDGVYLITFDYNNESNEIRTERRPSRIIIPSEEISSGSAYIKMQFPDFTETYRVLAINKNP